MGDVVTWHDHGGPALDSVASFTVIECERCAFRHVVPIPTPEDMEALYQSRYYAEEKPLYFERHREDLEWWNMVYAERYDRFERYLSPGHRRILDVGSGPGFFLKLGKERGWDTLGIEPSRQAAEHARSLGLYILNEFLSEASAGQLGTFDVIHMHEVMEHLPNPTAMARLCLRLLNPGGILNIIVPNDYNPLQRILRERLGYEPWWVAPPHHINYFTPHSLEEMVTAAGFQAVHMTTTFPMELFLLMGDNYVGNDALGRACHGRRKSLELALARGGLGPLKQQLYDALVQRDIGREIDLLARNGQ